jgi:hypothetical protein
VIQRWRPGTELRHRRRELTRPLTPYGSGIEDDGDLRSLFPALRGPLQHLETVRGGVESSGTVTARRRLRLGSGRTSPTSAIDAVPVRSRGEAIRVEEDGGGEHGRLLKVGVTTLKVVDPPRSVELLYGGGLARGKEGRVEGRGGVRVRVGVVVVERVVVHRVGRVAVVVAQLRLRVGMRRWPVRRRRSESRGRVELMRGKRRRGEVLSVVVK